MGEEQQVFYCLYATNNFFFKLNYNDNGRKIKTLGRTRGHKNEQVVLLFNSIEAKRIVQET